MKVTRQTNELLSEEEARDLTDFIMFSQSKVILRLSPELAQGKVSYPQFFLLTYLTEEDSLTISNIARMMGHSTAAATGMVDKLEEMGYVTRFQASADRRKTMVRITREGSQLVERMRTNIAKDLALLMHNQDGRKTFRKVNQIITHDKPSRAAR